MQKHPEKSLVGATLHRTQKNLELKYEFLLAVLACYNVQRVIYDVHNYTCIEIRQKRTSNDTSCCRIKAIRQLTVLRYWNLQSINQSINQHELAMAPTSRALGRQKYSENTTALQHNSVTIMIQRRGESIV